MRALSRWVVSLLLVFAAASSFAQGPVVTRGGALLKREYQTYSTTTLYVDGTLGSDSNACVASGASACRTLAGALGKLPRILQYPTTVNIAAGTYAETFRVRDFTLSSPQSVGAPAASLNITGTLTTSDTGTATGYTPYSGLTKTAFTDSTKSWTVNQHRGRLLYISSGTGSGQYMVIASNTATVLSLVGSYTTAPVAGSGYSIMSQGTVFTGTTPYVSGLNGGATSTLPVFTISNVRIAPSTGNGGVWANSNTSLRLVQIELAGASSTFGFNGGISNFSIVNSYLTAGTGSGPFYQFSNSTSHVLLNDVLIHCTGTCAGGGTGGYGTKISALSGVISGSWSYAVAFDLLQSPLQSTRLWIDCPSTAMNGVYLSDNTDSTTSASSGGYAFSNGPFITGCGVGIKITNPGSSWFDAVQMSGVTTAVQVSDGARVNITNMTVTGATNGFIVSKGATIDLQGTTPTLTTVTNEITVDGTVYTLSNLTGLSPALIRGPYNSSIQR